MPRKFSLICAALLCSALFDLGSVRVLAQRINCETSFEFKGAKQVQLSSLLETIAEQQATSVVAEISFGNPSVDVPSGYYTVPALVKRFSPTLHCETVQGVLHIFDQSIVSSKGNALNYQFAFFKMPPNVDKFRTMLTQRLGKEAFSETHDNRSVIQELGGGRSWNADQFPLQEQSYRDIPARDLVLSVASKYVLSSIICFPDTEKISSDHDVWKFAADHWYWAVRSNRSNTCWQTRS